MRKVIPLIALLFLAPTLGGCNTVAEALARAAQIMSQVRTSLAEVREGIAVGCSALGIAEAEAAAKSEACGVKVTRLKAGVLAICQNRALLTDEVVGNYFSSVANAVKQAQKACPA